MKTKRRLTVQDLLEYAVFNTKQKIINVSSYYCHYRPEGTATVRIAFTDGEVRYKSALTCKQFRQFVKQVNDKLYSLEVNNET